jgi:hypothetical protein
MLSAPSAKPASFRRAAASGSGSPVTSGTGVVCAFALLIAPLKKMMASAIL